MRSIRRPYARALLLTAGVALVLVCGLFRPMTVKTRSAPEELAAAQERWAARQFARYRLAVEYSGGLIDCRQDAEIRGEAVVAIMRNTCPLGVLTVTDVFNRIDVNLSTRVGRCGPNGCGCDGTVGVDATYDASLGYPRQMNLRLRPEERWHYPGYWRYTLLGGACTLIGFRSETINIVSLTPVP
jgi:hypothetical protein